MALTLIVAMTAGIMLGQNYKANPSGWTPQPSPNLTKSGKTYYATTSDGMYIMAKAVIDNDDKTITFSAKKSDWTTFTNNVSIVLYKDIVISGSTITSWGSALKTGSANSGDSEVSVTITPDFSSGSHKYTIVLVSSVTFYTYPITITAEEEQPAAPYVTTWAASDITTTSATLRGSVTPNGASTSYRFHWGTSSSSMTNFTDWEYLPAGWSSVSVEATITGLSPSQTYHYRLVASNSVDATYGTSMNFTTEAPANNAPTKPSNPNPANGATNVNNKITVSWSCSDSDGDELTYYLYLGESTSSWTKYTTTAKSYSFSLKENTPYYWKVDAYDGKTTTYGSTWNFTTGSGGVDNELEQAVTYLYGRSIIEGSTPSAANTSNPLLRQHLAKMAFYGAYGSESAVPSTVPSDNYPSIYDLNVSTYYYRAVKALLYLEYCDGVTPFDRNRLTFDQNEEVPRIHVLKALMEAFNQQPDMSSTPLSYTDLSSLDNQPRLKGYLRKAISLGIVNTSLTTWRPSEICTRGEAILMLYRLMNKVGIPTPGDTDYFQPLNTTMKTISMGAGLQLGNFQHYTKTSFTLDGVVPLNFSHAYNSYNTTLPGMFFGESSSREAYLPLADGWTHTYHTFITKVDDYVIVHWGGGSIDVYTKNGSTWKPVSMGVYDEMTSSGNTFVIKTKSQVSYTFGKYYAGVSYLTKVVDRNNNTLTVSYETGQNSEPRISTVTDGNGRSLTFSYKEGTNLIHKITDPLERNIVFGYTINGTTGRYQLSGFKDAKQNQTRYYYGNSSKFSTSKLLTQIKLPNGNFINNTYNENNYRLTQTENGDSKTEVKVTSNYDGSISTTSEVKVTHANGTSTYNYAYNANNVMTSMSGPESMNVTIKPYGTTGMQHLPQKITTNSMNISNIDYDENGNVLQVDVTGDGKTLTTKYEYNSKNDVTKVTDPMGYVTTYSYTNGNLTKVQSPISGVYTNISRNSNGTPSMITDGEGVSVTYGYDSYGHINKVTLPGSLVTVPKFDAAGRLESIKDAKGNIYSYDYDYNDNQISETDPAGNNTSYSYDNNDNLTGITNAKGEKTTLEYDFDTDRLTSVSFEGATRSYTYNEDGTLKSFTKPDGTTLSYRYDNLGRVKSDGINSYSYDSKLRLKSISGNGKTISFGYDGFNRITSAGDATYTYDDNSNVKSVNDTEYEYDKLNRLTSVTFNNKTIYYSYRNDSQLSKVEYPNGMTTTFGYDSAGRLTSKQTKLGSKVVAGYSYELDKVGNIVSQTTQEPYSDMNLANESTSYSYNSGNRITKAGDITFSFDQNGNTTKRGSESFGWNNYDQLTRAGSTDIQYDPLGLIASYGDITFTTDPLGIGNVLSDSKSGAQYIYGNGLEARVIGSKVSYYVTDVRGSVVAIVDDNGNITHKYQYDEFGKVTQKEEADYNPFQYVGKYGVMYLNDHLYYMRARHYDPTIGRFLSEDPIWSTNLYPYADNNPIMGADPRGLSVEIMKEIAKTAAKKGTKTPSQIGNAFKSVTNYNNLVAKNNIEVAKDAASADALIAGWGKSDIEQSASSKQQGTQLNSRLYGFEREYADMMESVATDMAGHYGEDIGYIIEFVKIYGLERGLSEAFKYTKMNNPGIVFKEFLNSIKKWYNNIEPQLFGIPIDKENYGGNYGRRTARA